MSSFDTTLNPLGLNLAMPDEANIDPENPSLQMVIAVGTIIPIDTGNGQPLPVPIGLYRVPIWRSLAIDLGHKLVEAGENLPEPVKRPDIALPGGLNENAIRQAMETERRFRGDESG